MKVDCGPLDRYDCLRCIHCVHGCHSPRVLIDHRFNCVEFVNLSMTPYVRDPDSFKTHCRNVTSSLLNECPAVLICLERATLGSDFTWALWLLNLFQKGVIVRPTYCISHAPHLNRLRYYWHRSLSYLHFVGNVGFCTPCIVSWSNVFRYLAACLTARPTPCDLRGSCFSLNYGAPKITFSSLNHSGNGRNNLFMRSYCSKMLKCSFFNLIDVWRPIAERQHEAGLTASFVCIITRHNQEPAPYWLHSL